MNWWREWGWPLLWLMAWSVSFGIVVASLPAVPR